jgi:hypothetical protein
LFECLLRCYPSETFEGLISDGKLQSRFNNIIRFLGYPPVCELFVMLVAFTPVSRSSQLFAACEKSRWAFLQELNKWNLLFHLTEAVVSPSQVCHCSAEVTDDQHSTAACQLLQDLIEKVSLEDTGDLLLVPLGQDSSIVDLLVDTVVDRNSNSGLRRSASKIICFLLRRAAESEIVCFVTTSPNIPPTTTYLPNRLFALRERIVSSVKDRIEAITGGLLIYDEGALASSCVKYSSYEVKKPFGTLRLLMIEIIVLTVESDETVAATIPLDLWKNLISWTLKYAHNNIYHALFYRIIFAVLRFFLLTSYLFISRFVFCRQGQESPQKILFQKAKFASFLSDNFFISSELDVKDGDSDLLRRKLAIRGLIMNCANAIRLQVSTQSPTSFLVNFLGNHSKWNEFITQLTVGVSLLMFCLIVLLQVATDIQLKFGMGIKITVMDSKNFQQNSMMMLVSEAKPNFGIIIFLLF